MDKKISIEKQTESRASQMRFMLLAIATGIFTGTIGSFFHLAIDKVIQWPNYLGHYVSSGWPLVVAAALITMCLTVFAVFIVQRYAPEAGGSGVQEIEGAMSDLRTVRWKRVLPVKFFTGISSISSGLVLGREGPTIHIGASISAALTSFFKVGSIERRGLLGAGAAAGLSCAFNAPLASIFFVVEETHDEFPYTFSTYMGVIAAVFFATVMTQIIGGQAPDFSMAVAKPELMLLPLFVIMGCMLGFIGVSLNACIMWATGFSAKMQKKIPYLYPAVIGLVVGALFILMPFSVTGGENLIIWMGHHKASLLLLLALAVLRYFTMVGSYSAGTPGGIFAPMLSLAICIGLVFGTLIDIIAPDAGTVPLAFGIAAMGGLFAASVRSPIVGVALTLELTGSYTMMMPLIATCLTANLTAQWIGGKPIYTELLDRILKQGKV